MVSISRLLQMSPPTSFSRTKFLTGLFIVWEEVLDQPFIAVTRLFAKDNAFSKKIRSFVWVNYWLVLILLFCLNAFYGVFYSSVIMKWRIKTSCCFLSVSEETKFKVDTTSIVLSYLYHFKTVKEELFRHIPNHTNKGSCDSS